MAGVGSPRQVGAPEEESCSSHAPGTTLNLQPQEDCTRKDSLDEPEEESAQSSPSLCLGTGGLAGDWGWVGDVQLIKDRPCSSLHTHTAMKINRDDLWGLREENFKGSLNLKFKNE